MTATSAHGIAPTRVDGAAISGRSATMRATALIASFDAIALGASVVWSVPDAYAALAFPLVAFTVLMVSGAFTVGLNPAALDWAPWLVQRVALSALVLAPRGRMRPPNERLRSVSRAAGCRGTSESPAPGADGL